MSNSKGKGAEEMYAIVEEDGKQLRVSEGEVLKVDKRTDKKGDTVVLDKVLLISENNRITLGSPYINNAQVSTEVVGDGKDRKVLVFKMKPRKGFRRLRGHRQPFTLLRVKEISGG